jgi:hypothetical protein
MVLSEKATVWPLIIGLFSLVPGSRCSGFLAVPFWRCFRPPLLAIAVQTIVLHFWMIPCAVVS